MSYTRETRYRVVGNPSIEHNEQPYETTTIEKDVRSHNYFPTIGENGNYSVNKKMPMQSNKQPMSTQIRIRASAPIGGFATEEDKNKKKKKKSFIEKWIQKAESAYKNPGGKQTKLLYTGNDFMMFPNEYLNTHPTDRVKYRKRTPNETSVQSDFNKINVKPFIRCNQRGKDVSHQKARIVLSSKGVPPYTENPMSPVHYAGSPLNRCHTAPAIQPLQPHPWGSNINTPSSSPYPNLSILDGRRTNNGLEKERGNNPSNHMHSSVPSAEVGFAPMGMRKNVSFQNSKYAPKRNMQYSKRQNNKSVVDQQGNVVLRIITNDDHYEPEVFQAGNKGYMRKASYDKNNAPMNSSIYSFSCKNEMHQPSEHRRNKTPLLRGTKSLSSTSYIYPPNSSYENENVNIVYEPSTLSTSQGNQYIPSYKPEPNVYQHVTEYKNKSPVPSMHMYTKECANYLDPTDQFPCEIDPVEYTKMVDVHGKVTYVPVTSYVYTEAAEPQEVNRCSSCCSNRKIKGNTNRSSVLEHAIENSKKPSDWNCQEAHECTCNFKMKPSTCQHQASYKEVPHEEWTEKGSKQTSDGTEIKYNETISDFNSTDNSKNKYSSVTEITKRTSKISTSKGEEANSSSSSRSTKQKASGSVVPKEEGSSNRSSKEKSTKSNAPSTNTYGLGENETLKEESSLSAKSHSMKPQRSSSSEKVSNSFRHNLSKEDSKKTNSKIYESLKREEEEENESEHESSQSKRYSTGSFAKLTKRSNPEIKKSTSGNDIERRSNTERTSRTERSNKSDRNCKSERTISNKESGIYKMIKDKSNYSNTVEPLPNNLLHDHSRSSNRSRTYESREECSDSLQNYQSGIQTNRMSVQKEREGTSRSRKQSSCALREPMERHSSERNDLTKSFMSEEKEEAIVPYTGRHTTRNSSRTKETSYPVRDRSLLQLKDYETLSDQGDEINSFSNLALVKRESIPKTLEVQNSIKRIKDWERETNEEKYSKYFKVEDPYTNRTFTNKPTGRYTFAEGDRERMQNENSFSHLKTLPIQETTRPLYSERNTERDRSTRKKDSTSEFGIISKRPSQMTHSKRSYRYPEDPNIPSDIRNKGFSDLHPDSYNDSIHSLNNIIDYELKPNEDVQFQKLSSHDYMQSVNESKSRNTMRSHSGRKYQNGSSYGEKEYEQDYQSDGSNHGYMNSFDYSKSGRSTRNQSMYSGKALTKETQNSPHSYRMIKDGTHSRYAQSRSYGGMPSFNTKNASQMYSKSKSMTQRSRPQESTRSQKSINDIDRNSSRREYETIEHEDPRTLDTCSFRDGGGISPKISSISNQAKYTRDMNHSNYNVSNREVENRNRSSRMSRAVSRGTTKLSNRMVDKSGTFTGRNDMNPSVESFGERTKSRSKTLGQKSGPSEEYPNLSFGRSRTRTERGSIYPSASMHTSSRRSPTQRTEPLEYSNRGSSRNNERSSRRFDESGTNRKLKNTYEIYEENSIHEPNTEILERQIPEDLFYHGASDGEVRNINSERRTQRTGESRDRNGTSYIKENTFGQRSKSSKIDRFPSTYSKKSRNTETFRSPPSNSMNASRIQTGSSRQTENRGYSFRNEEEPVENLFYSKRVNSDQVKSTRYSNEDTIRKIRSDTLATAPLYDASTVNESNEHDWYPEENSYSQRKKSTQNISNSFRKSKSYMPERSTKSVTNNSLFRGNTYHTCNKDIIFQKKPTLNDSLENINRISNPSKSKSKSQLTTPAAYSEFGMEDLSRSTRKSKSKSKLEMNSSRVPVESTIYSKRNEIETNRDLQGSVSNRFSSKKNSQRSMYSFVPNPTSSVRKTKSAISERNSLRASQSTSKSMRKGNTNIPYETIYESGVDPYISSSNVKDDLSDTANFAFSQKEESLHHGTMMDTSTTNMSQTLPNRSNLSMRSKSRNTQKSWKDIETNQPNNSIEEMSDVLYDTGEREPLTGEIENTIRNSQRTNPTVHSEVPQSIRGTASFKKSSGTMLHDNKSNLTKFQLTDTSQDTGDVTSHIDIVPQHTFSQKSRTTYIPNTSLRNQESRSKTTRRSTNKSTPLISNPFSKKNMSEQCRKKISSSMDTRSSETSFETISSKDRDFDLYYVERLPYKKKFDALLPKVLGGRKHKREASRKKERTEREQEETVAAMEQEMIPIDHTSFYPISTKRSSRMIPTNSKIPSYTTNLMNGTVYDTVTNRTGMQSAHKSKDRTKRGTTCTLGYPNETSSKVISTPMEESIQMVEPSQTRIAGATTEYDASYRTKEKREHGSDGANSLGFFESTQERIPRELLMSERKAQANNSCNTSFTSDECRSVNTALDPATVHSSRYQKQSNEFTGEMRNQSNQNNNSHLTGKSNNNHTAKFATDPSEHFSEINSVRNSRPTAKMNTNPRMNTPIPIYENRDNSRYRTSQPAYDGTVHESVRRSRESTNSKNVEEYAGSYGDSSKYGSMLESKPSVLSQGMNCMNQRSMYEMYSDDNINNPRNQEMNPGNMQSFSKNHLDSPGVNASRRYDEHGNSFDKQLSNVNNQKSSTVHPSVAYRRDSSYPLQRESSNHDETSQAYNKFSPMTETVPADSHESSIMSREYSPSHRNSMNQNSMIELNERSSNQTHQSVQGGSQMLQPSNQNQSFNRSRSSMQKSRRSGQPGASVLGIENANEFMKNQLNYILEHTDDEMDKNSRMVSNQMDQNNMMSTNPNNTISSQRNNSVNTERSFEDHPRSYAPSGSMMNTATNHGQSRRTSIPVQNQNSYNAASSIPRISYENGASLHPSQSTTKTLYKPSTFQNNMPSHLSHEFSNELNQKSMNWNIDENRSQRELQGMQGNSREYNSPTLNNTSEYKYTPIDGSYTMNPMGSNGREQEGLLTRSMINLPMSGLSQQSMYCNPNYSMRSSMTPTSLPHLPPILIPSQTMNTNVPIYNSNDHVTGLSQNSQECVLSKDGSEGSYRGNTSKGILQLNSGGNIIKLNEPSEKNYSTLIRQLDLKEMKPNTTQRTGNTRSFEMVPKSSYVSTTAPQEIHMNTIQSNAMPQYSNQNSRKNTHMSNFSLMNNSNVYQNSTATLHPRETKSSSSLMTPSLIHSNGNMSHVNTNGVSNIINNGSGITISNNASKIDNGINASASTIGISNNVSRIGSINGASQVYNEGFTNRQSVNSFSYVNPSTSNISIPFERNTSGTPVVTSYAQGLVSNRTNGSSILGNQSMSQVPYSNDNININTGDKSSMVSPYVTNRSHTTGYTMTPTNNNNTSKINSMKLNNNMSFHTEPTSVPMSKHHMSTPNVNVNMNSRSNSYRY